MSTRYIVIGVAELILAVGLGLFLRTFVSAFTFVKGNSMQPTLKNGDVAWVRMCRGRRTVLRRGDVVLCRYPGRGRKFFVKRIVGLPGDTVSRVSGVTMVGGVSLDARAYPARGDYEYVLAEDEYFCVGDNRANSHDSRDWQRFGSNQVGPIRRSAICGVVRAVIWPGRSRQKIGREFAFAGVQPVLPPNDMEDTENVEEQE